MNFKLQRTQKSLYYLSNYLIVNKEIKKIKF